ncbi:GTPase HflX [Rhodococcus sp. BP-252]|nr:GTPase HflX [Rhodococcus sp. BP-320]MBY6415648.1 GTPase HflX [Rhodococcus sp. BP-321]MBY6420970.1 GTPase HflX [Rhodococcus sp. BP-324]MBY6426025.1 GTPase HflX [Rhodococcus sp. BP-323]MBY6430854.1 GTPase HflX [Rhodococcus sp. BP-322]MBY6440238.1 GTPase HflX [Rhodococcus sp. BP-319]MBY6444691.1 GTPase HflX [Rhodococcus sp. BP-318]MBY6449741.1 GTPase HflX [Rhodococcus sp. BP-315]MBY6454326.1 GTPase HflX [Rhodococcus sp. BP-277]MBY6459255.1 GTPase HflX [Rhodococcus sp. BP-260]MBY6464871.1 
MGPQADTDSAERWTPQESEAWSRRIARSPLPLDEDTPSSGDMQLEERTALRRVAGLSTELADVTEVEYRQLRLERVVLVGVWTSGTAAQAENSMAELAALAETAGSEVLDALMQRRDKPDPATYIGSGKAHELRDVVLSTGADTVICDGELTPAQLNALEKVVKVKVIDRTALILDIFAQHATSREGKAQVAFAQMEYMLPRLRGWGESMSRQAGGRAGSNGGVGLRGPGETKIETDRRRIRERMAKLRREIKGMKQARDTKRERRVGSTTPNIAIVGYTNAGKSSLLNKLTGSGVLVQNALFATLDPTSRKSTLDDGRAIVLTDTVGFVRHLPTQLVEAFRSTLEEVTDADLLLHVVDGSDPLPTDQIKAVREVIMDVVKEHDAPMPPELIVVNKIDAADPVQLTQLRGLLPGARFVSARTGEGVAELRDHLGEILAWPEAEVDVLIPYTRGDLVARIHSEGRISESTHEAGGTHVAARVPHALASVLSDFAYDAVTA